MDRQTYLKLLDLLAKLLVQETIDRYQYERACKDLFNATKN